MSASTAENMSMDDQDWPEPEPLAPTLPRVHAFDACLLPEAMRPWTIDVAERMSVPAEMVAVPEIGALATVIAGRCAVQPKQYDDGWLVIPNLWGLVIGNPGTKKSPAVTQAIAPLLRLEEQAFEKYKRDLAAYKAQKVAHERQSAAMQGNVDEPPALPKEPQKPTLKRYLVNDATAEKLIELLRDNPAGLLLYRDEMQGFLRQLTKPGREGERQFYLEAWEGSSSYTTDRIMRGTVRAGRVCLSVLGTIQPGPMSDYVRRAVHHSGEADGLLQRFQLLIYPDSEPYRHVDRKPDHAARQQYQAIFDRLGELRPEPPLRLRFAGEAQALFDRWFAALERELAASRDDAALIDHLSKYRSLMPSLACIFELVQWAACGDGPPPCRISVESADHATAWCAWLENHARRVYALGHVGQRSPAALLADRIRASALGAQFTKRGIQQRGWRGLTRTSAIVDALSTLCERHWIRRAPRPEGKRGRPPESYLVNPRITLEGPVS